MKKTPLPPDTYDLPERRDVAWYAVRCCCKPNTIFGFLSLEPCRQQQKVKDRRGNEHTVELRPIAQICVPDNSWEYRSIVEPVYEQEVAVYSDDRPIEFWREIPGFIEAVSDDASGSRDRR